MGGTLLKRFAKDPVIRSLYRLTGAKGRTWLTPIPTEQFSGTKDVAESHKFDEAKLDAWMKANVEGYKGPLEVRQFKGGQSNPTYQLITPKKKYVMRRKPPGKLLPSAHAVDREYPRDRGAASARLPGAAQPYGLCEDESVIGTMFYVMDMVEGRILWDATLPDYTPAERRAIFDAKVSTFAALHNVDWRKAGPRRLRQGGRLRRPPDPPLDQAIPDVRDARRSRRWTG